MRGALLTVAALCASAAAAPLSAPSLQHSLSISLSPEYEAMLFTDSALEASFNLVTEESLGAFLDATVNVVGITASTEASVHRRAQASDSVTINYIVKCGADGCLDEKAKLTNMDTTQMGNIMQAIDDHAFSTGFGTSATCVGHASKADCAAAAIAAMPAPGVVSINLFTGAPTTPGTGAPTPSPTVKISLCVSANPCFTKGSCSDDGAGGASCGACPAGYTGDGKSCVDVDDCSGWTACGIKGACKDTGTLSVSCTCGGGYQANTFSYNGVTGQKCSLTSACLADEDDCVTEATCNHDSNAQGNHTCVCSAGLQGDGKSTGSKCSDINGCAAAPCDSLTACADTPAPGIGYSCGACPSGYTGDGKSGCTDVNDCNGNPCAIGAGGKTCTDLCTTGNLPVGSCGTSKVLKYTCSCLPGYAFFGGKCRSTSACHAEIGEKCVDSSMTCSHDDVGGSFACACPAGKLLAGSTCVEKNDCAADSCDKLSVCHDTPAPNTGFTCDSCPKGYYESWVAKKQVCTDLDDCTANPCGAGALSCQNKPGVSHKCTCKAGFTAAYHCGDMPAAKLTTYLAKFGLAFAGDCAALVATYGCKGSLPFTAAGVSGTETPATACMASCNSCGEMCDVYNACAADEDDCSTYGTCSHPTGAAVHTCACNTGYTGDGKACTDTNGCAGTPCDKLTTCSDIAAPNTGFACSSCPDGYSGSGDTSCNDINDCLGAGAASKCVSPDTKFKLTCVNNAAGFGHTCDCGDDYFSKDGTCFIKNKCTLNPCDSDATCNSGANGAFTCKCNKGFTGDGLLSCVDTNGCDPALASNGGQNPCDALTTCSDLAATSDSTGFGFKCTACPSGYDGTGETTCSDVDDCTNNPCGAAGTCTNDGAGTKLWKCACALGYSAVQNSADVSQTDPAFFETAVDPLTVNSVKTNDDGTNDYVKSGKVMVPKFGFTCADAAKSANWGCDKKLKRGYWFGRSYAVGPAISLVCRASCGTAGPTCSTVDSCVGGTHNCDKNAVCSHVVVHGSVSGAAHSADSYTCTCKGERGFGGNGYVCSDKDACQQQSKVCGKTKLGDVASGKGCCNALTAGCSDSAAGPTWSSNAQFACPDCPSGYTTGNDPTTFKQSCTDIADCGTPAQDICLAALGSSSAAQQVLGLCKIYGVAKAASLTCGQFAAQGVTAADCVLVSQFAVAHFGASCAKEAAGLKLFCPILGAKMGDANPCGTSSSSCAENGAGTGKYTCSCNTGYVQAAKGGKDTCIINDECAADSDDCVEGLTSCLSTTAGGVASHVCKCQAGYQGDGKTAGTGCTDINYCKATSCWAGTEAQKNTAERLGACRDQTPDKLPDTFTCQPCPAGFVGSGTTCTDADDCAAKPCGSLAIFANACADAGFNAYTCTCPTGYKGTADGMTTCTLDDPCAATEDDCVTAAGCTHTGPGAHSCQCPTGFEGDGTKNGNGCTDINGCAGSPCSSLVVCSDTPAPGLDQTCGSCPTGYEGDGIGSNGCTDIDACKTQSCPTLGGGAGTPPACYDSAPPSLGRTCDPCPTGYDNPAGSVCADTDGCAGAPCNALSSCSDVAAPGVGGFGTGYTCAACASGYSGDGNGKDGCKDVNDCTNNACGSGTCTDAGANTYTCACNAGYKSLGDALKPTCMHVDACKSAEDDCVNGATCNHDDTSSAGSPKHTCTCSAGFQGDGTKSGSGCTDIDACASGPCATLSGAGTAPACTDKKAPDLGYTCADCPTGYANPPVPQASGALVCVDANACANNPCFSGVKCNDDAAPNTAYTCDACPRGMSGNAIGPKGCTDDDGCANAPCPTLGSGAGTAPACTDLKSPATGFTCAPCPVGYNNPAVNNLCIDTNACANGPCDQLTTCSDQKAPGTSFACSACPSGYSGNSVTASGGCTDIDDCAGSPCGGPAGSTCTDAGPNKYTCTCGTGYDSVGSGKPTCQLHNACSAGEDDCTKSPAATCNHMGSGKGAHTCTCPSVGYFGDGKASGSGCKDVNGCSPNQCATLEGAGTPPACTDTAAPGTGYTCADCPTGYDVAPVNGVCKDTNSCPTGASAPCHPLSSCTDQKAPLTSYTCGACPSGYIGDGYTAAGCSANLADDCANTPCGSNLPSNICTDGGVLTYTCACPAGYKNDGKTCLLNNPCAASEDDCVTGLAGGFAASCNHNGPGQHSCSCPTGFAGDGTKSGTGCTDVDACAAKPCPALSGAGTAPTCTDDVAPGVSYKCSPCPTGYASGAVMVGTQLTCIDDLGCSNNPCDGLVTCTESLPPAGANARTCSACPAGYTGDSGTVGGCTVNMADDCAVNPCGKGSCTDTGLLSYSCACPAGYSAVGTGKALTCSHADACASDEDDCVVGLAGPTSMAKCTHDSDSKVGAPTHTCTCPAGFTGSGKSTGNGCTDINACATKPCPVLAKGGTAPTCTDQAAPLLGYTCTPCPTSEGYDATATMVNGKLTCTDTDGCANSPCSSLSTCSDKSAPLTGFVCSACPSGYTGDGTTCTRTPMCTTNPCGSATTTCIESADILTYTCICPTGYASLPLNSKTPVCKHIDACKSSENDCVKGLAGPTPEAGCIHDPASPAGNPRHSCLCPAGYVGDGRTSGTKCTDPDSCVGATCTVLPAGGKGVAPKCTDKKAPFTGFTCGSCPVGYTGTMLVNGVKTCKDTNGCKKNMCRKRWGQSGQPANNQVKCTDLPAPGTEDGYTCSACPKGTVNAPYVVWSKATSCESAGFETIKTLAECSAAYTMVQMGRTTGGAKLWTAVDDKQDKANFDPAGCYYEAGTLKFNVKMSNTGTLTTWDMGICKVKATADKRERRCTDIDDCQVGPDGKARTTNPCAVKGSNAVFTCADKRWSGKYQCTCPLGYKSVDATGKGTPTCVLADACSSAEDDCAYLMGKTAYKRFTKGKGCKGNGYVDIVDPVTCAAAATVLKLKDQTVTPDNQNRVTYDPKGCYYEGNSLKFNVKMSNTGACTNADACICAPPKASCAHTKGSSPPTHTCTCPAAYTGNGKIACADKNECKTSTGTNPCATAGGVSLACTDAKAPASGYSCAPCPTGYSSVVDKITKKITACVEIDGCADDPCHAQSKCADNKAPATGFKCGACPAGWAGDGIVKGAGSIAGYCGTTSKDSGHSAFCKGLGSDQTVCNNYMTKRQKCRWVTSVNKGGTGCKDVDDCKKNPCGTSAGTACTDIGTLAWSCQCNAAAGYSSQYPVGGNAKQPTCKVANACKASVDDCVATATCISVGIGGHGCQCGTGYTADSDGKKGAGKKGCVELDECKVNPCPMAGTTRVACTDKKAPATGYTCAACPSGYSTVVKGGVTTCVDTNACKPDPCDPLTTCSDDKPPSIGFTCGSCPKGSSKKMNKRIKSSTCAKSSNMDIIKTKAACQEAATELGLKDKTATTRSSRQQKYYPPGCHMYDRKYSSGRHYQYLYWNPRLTANGKDCRAYNCLCKSAFTAGSCVDIDDCAAKPCGSKAGNTCQDAYNGASTTFDKYRCSCRAKGYASVGSSPGKPKCAITNACSAQEDDCDTVAIQNYYLQSTGKCAKYITSNADCAKAAKYLKSLPRPYYTGDQYNNKRFRIVDTTVTNENQVISYDPKGCYYEYGNLKFNQGLYSTRPRRLPTANKKARYFNRGKCSTYDKCLCDVGKTYLHATCNHDSTSTAGAAKHTCTCPPGFVGNGLKKSAKGGTSCTQFDACAGTNPCPALGTARGTKLACKDIAPPSTSYTCGGGTDGKPKCPVGYDAAVVTLSSGATICADTDGCAAKPCYTGTTCTDKAAPKVGYTCSACPSGYSGNSIGPTGCLNVNDCLFQPGGSKRSTNPCGTAKGTGCFDDTTTINKYACTCATGYQLSGTGLGASCVHFNACASGENDCATGLTWGAAKSATCNHIAGGAAGAPSHTCTCPPGYDDPKNDGKKSFYGCKQVDSCKTAKCAVMPAGYTGVTAPKCTDKLPPFSGYTCSACGTGFEAPVDVNGVLTCKDTNGCASTKVNGIFLPNSCDTLAGCNDVKAPKTGYTCGSCPAGTKDEKYRTHTKGLSCTAVGMSALTTKAECEGAAKELKFRDTSALSRTPGRYTVPGCSYYQSSYSSYMSLYWAPGACKDRRGCRAFSKLYPGMCRWGGKAVESGEKCADVDDCGFDNSNTARKANPCGTKAVGVDKPICTDAGRLRYTCKCPTGYESVGTLSPTCKLKNACTASEDDCSLLTFLGSGGYGYTKITSGTCASAGYSMPTTTSECNTAAGWLKKNGKTSSRADVTATALKPKYSFYPIGCFYTSSRYTNLYLSTVNTGKCSAFRPCMCRKAYKAKCNHDSSSVAGAAKHTCTCPAGYGGDGKSGRGATGCKNFDACAIKPCPIINNGVGAQPTCDDLAPPSMGYKCNSCPAGYDAAFVIVNGKKTCKDTDGCKGNVCDPAASCSDKKAPAMGATCGKCPSGMFGTGLAKGKCHNKKKGAKGFCTTKCKCGDGEGACTSDFECIAGARCAADPSEAMLTKNGAKCPNLIRTKAACEQAAGLMGLSDKTASSISSRIGNNYPPGCFYRVYLRYGTKYLYWNGKLSSKKGMFTTGTSSKVAHYPICAQTKAKCQHKDVHHTVLKTTDKKKFGRYGVGCKNPIRTKAACEATAKQMGMSDTTATDYGRYTWARNYYPYGCTRLTYTSGTTYLYFNARPTKMWNSTRLCSKRYQCMCPGEAQPPAPAPPAGCTDINDCMGVPCGAKGLKCTDTGLNSYKCDCPKGYRSVGPTGKPGKCVHVNACSSGENNCWKSGNYKATCNHNAKSPAGKPTHTCTCPAGKDGPGSNGIRCNERNGCSPNPCATIPRGGIGKRPKCTDNRFPKTGATCAKCPAGYNPNPATVGGKKVCVDANDCKWEAKKLTNSCGPASTKNTCKDSGGGRGLSTCNCPKKWISKKHPTQGAFCFLDPKPIYAMGGSKSCSNANTEQKILVALAKMCPTCGIVTNPPPAKDTLESCAFTGNFCNLKASTKNRGGSGYWRTGKKTPSGGTGPNTAKDGSYFAFTEASGAGRNQINYLQNEKPYMANGAARKIKQISFWYAMIGANFGGYIKVEKSTDGKTWSAVKTVNSGKSKGSWRRVGRRTVYNQGASAWVDTKTIAINAPYFRVVVRSGTSYRGDAAIDKMTWVVTA